MQKKYIWVLNSLRIEARTIHDLAMALCMDRSVLVDILDGRTTEPFGFSNDICAILNRWRDEREKDAPLTKESINE